MKIVKLSESLSVSAQIAVDDVALIAEAGYDVIINNRPDGEEPGQPASDEIAAAAAAAGLTYVYLPVTAQDFPGPGYQQMSELLADEGQRTLAFCRSGTRCTNLWVVSREPSVRDEALEVARQNGYELVMATRHLEAGQ